VKQRVFLFALCLITLVGSAGADPKGSAPAKPTALDLQRESIRQQRQSLRQQLGIKMDATTSDFEFLTPITPLAISDCPALDADQVDSLIADASRKQSLSPQLIRAVMRQESAFKSCAVSIKGAQGLMQLMPSTAAQLHVSDPFDPAQNVQAGAAFLKQLLKRYNGDLRLTLVAYNAGSNRADQLDPSQYPAETQGYLANIFAALGAPE
jgi:soluble lytic murein transglycosylase-like protein